MKRKIYILFASLLMSCSLLMDENNSFEDRTYEVINLCNVGEFKKVSFGYGIYEFLRNNRLVSEGMIDSIVIQMQGNWKYFKKSNREYLVLEEIEQSADTFELICNKNFEYFEFINRTGDTLKFKEIKEIIGIDNKLILNSKWISTNDSLQIGYNEVKEDFLYIKPYYQFFEDGTYEFKTRNIYSGKWVFNKLNNRILLDSLKRNQDIITIEKLTVDTLVFWKRNYSNDPRKIVCIKEIND